MFGGASDEHHLLSDIEQVYHSPYLGNHQFCSSRERMTLHVISTSLRGA
jgi:hypothetical protein